MAERLAVLPGSFDPLTNGHVDMIRRATAIFDRVVVAILKNKEKSPLFSTAERIEIIGEAFRGDNRVEADAFDGLLVDYARARGACAIVRGIRGMSDFDYEYQMALMNRRLQPDVETVFIPPAEGYTFVSSRLIREVFSFGGDVTALVPPVVADRLRKKLARQPQNA